VKIGVFSKACGISKDTVRYYVNIGLLIPKARGAQLDFTQRELEDFHFIQKLKEMGFHLREIKAFLLLRRTSNMIEPNTIDEYQTLLEEKQGDLQRQILDCQRSLQLIQEELKNFEIRKHESGAKAGVPLKALSVLACPHCQKQLRVENAEIVNQSIHSGKLLCSCGYEALIRDGIVCTGNLYTGDHDSPDLNRKIYQSVGEEWAVYVQNCTDLMDARIEERSWKDKVILEANINGFFFIYNNIRQLPKDCLYIFVDKYEEILRMYKGLFEILEKDLEILYIADASTDYPLKERSIDLLVSFFGDNEHSLYHQEPYIASVDRFCKKNAWVVGAFQGILPESRTARNINEKYPEGSRTPMTAEYLRCSYERQGYQIELCQVGEVRKTYKHHMYTCHEDGEPIRLFYFQAQKE